MNKGSFFITFLAASTMLFSMAATPALASSNQTVIRGNVYDESNGGQGVGGLTVYVLCTSGHLIQQEAETDGNGLYTVNFSANTCGAYHPVAAVVKYNGQSQTDTGTVSAQGTATMDFYFGSVSVPEFGFIPGVVAAVASVGSFFALKRKKN